MKLRIKGDSLRLRISPSEMARLLETGRVEDTVHFGPDPAARLRYALEHSAQAGGLSVRYQAPEVTVVISTLQAQQWAGGADVGIYAEVSAGPARLEVAVEKDFACLDQSDAANHDAFPNPKQGAVC